ncbi:MAG TPA: hypothetical protein VJH65_03270 [Candidatus Nanoarchaeia archaeon]|nr:hypothetical protein [Candidatus Nanoarchaeia archaeon]
MFNKRGQGLSVNAIILIVLGIVVLVILIAGFTLGWQNIAPFLSADNVGTVAKSCQASCSTGDTYGFCTKERILKFDETIEGLTSGEKYTCNFLSGEQFRVKLGVNICPGLCAEQEAETISAPTP